MNPTTINPGDTLYISAAFEDAAGKVQPLGGNPTAADASNTLVITPLPTTGNPIQSNDPGFVWAVQCPKSAALGTSPSVLISGVNPDETPVPSLSVPFTIPDDDSQIVTTVSSTPPAGVTPPPPLPN